MKTAGQFARLLLVIAFFFCVTQTAQARHYSSYASSSGEPGRLIIKRSPALGYNVTITVYIDGQLAGAFVWGHTFVRDIAPGRHLLVARPNRLHGDWSGILDVHPGHTYAYVASCPVSHLFLDRIAPPRNIGY